jgi:hypothetical protein
MEGTKETDLEVGDRHDAEGPVLPEAVQEAERGVPTEPEVEMDATAWLMDSEGPTEEEIAPTSMRINIGTPETGPRWIIWKVVPLPAGEFKKFRRAAMGNRQQRRQVMQGDATAMDDFLYNRMVVAAATVHPDLQAAAAAKSVGGIKVDVLDVLAHRFAAKPLLISQISGVVSDISGGDEADVEVVAGN